MLFRSDPLLNPVRIGRSWSGGQNTFVGGLWTEESAYRTLIHELGHYALGIYDSYFRIEYVDGRFMGLTTAYCTAKSIRTNGQDATNATLMDYQYAASEFADQASDSWSEECTRTHQYIENNGESDWETIVRLFTDRADEKFRLLSPYDDAQWQLQTPRATGVLAGPTALPLQQIPMITTVSPSSTVLTSLLVQGPQQAIQLASVTLYVQKEGYTEAIDQGYTDRMGRILLLGARSGDRVNVLSRNTTYAGEITVIAGVTNTLLLEPTLPQMRASQQNEQPTYYVRLYPGAQNKNINVQLVGPAAGASVNAELSLTGHANGTEVILGYNNIAREYRGNLAPNFSDSTTMLTGLSQMWVIGKDVNDQPIYLTGSLELAILEPGKPQTVVSPDGKFLIFVPANGLPLNNGQTYLLISEHGTFGATTQLQPLSPIYQVRLSGSVAGFAAPTVFALRPNAELTDPNAIDTNNMQIYKFDEATQQWQPLPTIWNQQEQIASTEQLSTGYFALFAPQPVILPTTPTPAMPIQTTPTPITTGIPSETSTPFATATHQATPLASATPGATLTPTMTPKPLATPTPCIADVSCSPSYRIFLPVVAQ